MTVTNASLKSRTARRTHVCREQDWVASTPAKPVRRSRRAKPRPEAVVIRDDAHAREIVSGWQYHSVLDRFTAMGHLAHQKAAWTRRCFPEIPFVRCAKALARDIAELMGRRLNVNEYSIVRFGVALEYDACEIRD